MGFFELALLEALLLGALCGVVGTIVVLRRRAFFTTALTHATYPGGVAAAILGLDIVAGAAVASVGLVLIMTVLGRVRRQGPQVAAGIVLTSGFALGTMLQSLNPSLPVQADTFLVGSILTVSVTDIVLTGVVLVVAVAAVALVGKELLFSTFDPSGFRAAGFRPGSVDLLALGLIAATVVVAMPAVGSILSISLIVAPAAAARLVTDSVSRMLPVAVVVGIASGVLGLLASRAFSVAAGGAITLVAAGFFVLALVVSQVLGRTRVRGRA